MSRPIAERVGTQLDHRFVEKVYVTRKGRKVEAGSIDKRNRVYQWATESLSTAVFWKHRLLVLGTEEWDAIKNAGVDRLEYTDLGPNRLYACSMSTALRTGRFVDGPAGRRYGIPLDEWVVTESKAPTREMPALEEGATVITSDGRAGVVVTLQPAKPSRAILDIDGALEAWPIGELQPPHEALHKATSDAQSAQETLL